MGYQRSWSRSLFMADLFFVLIVLAHRRNTESFTHPTLCPARLGEARHPIFHEMAILAVQ